MYGGKLIGTGSSSCTLRPTIPCKGKGKEDVKKDRVSKILYNNDAKEIMEYEMEQTKLLSRIRGHKNWSIIYDEYCKAPSYHVIKEYDKKGILDCYGKNDGNFNGYILNSQYGGDTMDSIFKGLFSNTKTSIDNNFLIFMDMMKPLFRGLKEMNKNGVIHNDIKYSNIVEHNNVFKYIDFGLTSHISKKDNFRKRGLDEFNTKRFYYHYPLDYIYFYATSNELDNEEYTFSNRKNYTILLDIYQILDRNFFNYISWIMDDINYGSLTEEDMISKIDVYSLGIQVPLLFYFYSNIKKPYIKSSLINEFYDLFKDMTHPNPLKRITPSQSYNIYMKLMKKYKYTNKKSKKKKKSKRKRNKRG